MRPSIIGVIIGALLGFGSILGGLTGFLLVAVFGLAGHFVGRVVEGGIDLRPYLGGGNR